MLLAFVYVVAWAGGHTGQWLCYCSGPCDLLDSPARPATGALNAYCGTLRLAYVSNYLRVKGSLDLFAVASLPPQAARGYNLAKMFFSLPRVVFEILIKILL